jgi:hypothetical protein
MIQTGGQTQAQKETDRWTDTDLEGRRQVDRQAQKDTDRWTDTGAEGYRQVDRHRLRRKQTGGQTQAQKDTDR